MIQKYDDIYKKNRNDEKLRQNLCLSFQIKSTKLQIFYSWSGHSKEKERKKKKKKKKRKKETKKERRGGNKNRYIH